MAGGGGGDKNIPYFIVYIRRLPMEMRSHFNFIGLIAKAKKFFTLPGRKLLVTRLTPTPVARRYVRANGCSCTSLSRKKEIALKMHGNVSNFKNFSPASPRCAQKCVEIYGAYWHLRFTLLERLKFLSSSRTSQSFVIKMPPRWHEKFWYPPLKISGAAPVSHFSEWLRHFKIFTYLSTYHVYTCSRMLHAPAQWVATSDTTPYNNKVSSSYPNTWIFIFH